jgi:iron complex outermembrane receptor protein
MAIALCALAAHARAESAQTFVLSEAEYLGEMPVVLSASRLSQPISEAPSAITVIDRDMISASGFREIPELFRLVPGFYVGYYDGTMANVNHGLSDQYSRRMQVLVDGRSIYTPLFGGVEWADLPLAMDDIERIEVVRGPNAAAYGANAFMGIINIITRHAVLDQGLHLSAVSGDKGVGQGTLRYGGAQGALDYRFTLGYRQDSGFDNKYDSKRSQFLTFRGDYQHTSSDVLQFQLGYNVGEYGVGFANARLNQPRDRQIDSHFEQLRWVRTLGTDNELSVQFYHTYHNSNEAFSTIAYALSPSIMLNSTVLSSEVLAERYDLEIQHTLSPIKDLRIVWGAGVRQDQVNSPLYFNTHETLDTHLKRAFANLEWRMSPNLLLNAGVMVEAYDQTGTDTSPRLAMNYAFLPSHSLRASVSKAFRMPVLFEGQNDSRLTVPVTYLGLLHGTLNYPLSKGGGSLNPESIVSHEIGYVGEFKEWGVAADVRIFHDRIDDLISNHGIPGNAILQVGGATIQLPNSMASFRNQDSAIIGGIEAQVRFRPTAESQLIFNYSYSHVTSTDSESDIYSKTTPVHNLGLLGMHRLGGDWQASFGYYRVGGLSALGESTPVEAHQRLDLRLAKDFKVEGTRGEVAAVLQNILGNYNDFRNDNVFDRRAYLSLRLDY